MATVPYFSQELEAAHRDAPKRIVLDLDAVSFIDSSGLAVLLKAARHAAANSYELLLRRPSRQTMRLLELTGARRCFNVID